MKYFFSLIISLFGIKSFAQNFSLIGEWNVCVSENLNPLCAKGIVTYDFKKDGSFLLKGVKVDYADSVVFTGKWTLVENTLTLECNYNLKVSSTPMILQIVFLDHTRFYDVDEHLDNWKIYRIFQKKIIDHILITRASN